MLLGGGLVTFQRVPQVTLSTQTKFPIHSSPEPLQQRDSRWGIRQRLAILQRDVPRACCVSDSVLFTLIFL